MLLTTSHLGPGFLRLILNRGTRSMRFNDAVGIRSTVSLTMVCVVQSYEQPMALCIPPSLAHRKRHTGGCTASKSVISMLWVSTKVNICTAISHALLHSVFALLRRCLCARGLFTHPRFAWLSLSRLDDLLLHLWIGRRVLAIALAMMIDI